MTTIAIQSQGEIVKFESASVARKPSDDDLQFIGTSDEIRRKFSEIEDLVVTCCQSLKSALEKVSKPKEVELEFGVKVGGKAGIPFVTEGSGEANFKITVKWDNLGK
jgi:hypothetical protein